LNARGAASPQAFTIAAAARSAVTDTFEFDLSDVPAGSVPLDLVGGEAGSVPPGSYLARLRVDNVESPLIVDPASGAYDGPLVNV
jgi:hypothetical protein